MEEIIKETAETSVTKENKAEEKRTAKSDKLALLKAKQEKAAAAVEKASKKAKAIQDEIAAEEKKLHDKEIKQLDSLCKALKIEFADVINLIRQISENNLTFADITEMIGGGKNDE